jgi:hypothetical protein
MSGSLAKRIYLKDILVKLLNNALFYDFKVIKLFDVLMFCDFIVSFIIKTI